MSLLDLRVRELLDEIASERRVPGSGSVAALVAAAAAGLLTKVARASAEDWREAGGAAAQAEALRERLAPLAQVDLEAYSAALEAVADPREEEGGRRDFALGGVFARAAEPPLRIAEAAADVAMLAVTVSQQGDAGLRADAAAAGAFAAAAARAAAELVAVNLTAQAGDDRVRHASSLAHQAARAAEEAFASG